MTAQQQLARILKRPHYPRGGIAHADLLASHQFLRDHGPSIAELIEAAKKRQAELGVREMPAAAMWNYEQAKSSREALHAAETMMAAALRKLTQEAT